MDARGFMESRTLFADPSDESVALCDEVERSVRLRTSGSIRDLRVEMFAGELVLTGRTTTYYSKQLATHAVLDLCRDVALNNEIEVC